MTYPAAGSRPTGASALSDGYVSSARLGDERHIADRLAVFLSALLGGAVEIGAIERFSFGFSWITYGFECRAGGRPAQRLILRLGPPDGLFTPYTVAPQALSAAALAGSAVPVPAVLWSGDEPEPFGAPFLIVERATGAAVDPWTLVVTRGDPKGLAENFVDILARLHGLDAAGSPVAALAGSAPTAEAAAQAQVELWRGRIEAAQLRPHALLVEADLWFRANLPRPARLALVHGDYRVGNFLEENGVVSAVLDWELAHLGDPVEDLGWALLPMYNGGRKLLLGALDEAAVLERYGSATGIRVEPRHLAFYKAFALYKSAAIELLAARRFEEGRSPDMRLAGMGAQVPGLLRQIDRALERAAA